MKVAVVGGGVAGLTAAWELAGSGVSVTLFEAGPRLGGKIRTAPFAGRLVDEGADAFLARVPWAVELCDELGITTDLVEPAERSAFVWADGALHRLPPNQVLGVPTDFDAVQASGILRHPIQHRPDPEPLAPRADCTVGSLVRRQLGDEVLERLVDPLLGGINAASADSLSLRACAPQLAAAAERSGDLVAGLREVPAAPPGPAFLCPVGGMGALVDALAGDAVRRGVELRTGVTVTALADLQASETFDGFVLAVPGEEASRLISLAAPDGPPGLRGLLDYTSVVMATLAVPATGIEHPLDGTGFIVPGTEGLTITAVSWATSKWAHLRAADPSTAVLRVSLGRHEDASALGWDDATIQRAVTRDLATTIGLTADPVDWRITRWRDALPHYTPGHLARVNELEADLVHHLPNVAVAGAAYRGLGVPACIRQGREAALVLGVRLGV